VCKPNLDYVQYDKLKYCMDFPIGMQITPSGIHSSKADQCEMWP